MSSFCNLLGDKLLAGSGELVSTADAIAGKGAVAIYFSAHWCPPCRGFTPQLAEWYSSSLKAKGLEVIFVSSDRDDDSFQEYFKEMPWLALPYSDRERKETLSKKFKVSGIPALIILDADGKVITKDGRAAVSEDPTGEEFPWKPKTLAEVLTEAKIIDADGQELESGALLGKVFAFYFSAHWCPPCRGFTPKLVEWYTKSLKTKGLEVVFVSSDRDEQSFKDYFKEMPWLALDYADRKRKAQLSSMFGVRGIPALVIIDKDGSVITKEGRGAVSEDPEGVSFPWYPPAVANTKSGPGCINEHPTVLAFCETSSAEDQNSIEKALSTISTGYLEQQKQKGEEDPEFDFMIATDSDSSGIASRLRQVLSLPPLNQEPGVEPAKLMLIDIPSDGAFYEGPSGEITEAVVEKFVEDFKAGRLERKQLSC
jgi:nucleoredoxin